MTPLESGVTLSAGDRLGRYEILGALGVGGMGEVYRARDTELDREVAIKVLLEAVAQDPDRIARFEREARMLASLSHQNIATLHGLEEHEGQRFLVMELAEGETLAERLMKVPVGPDGGSFRVPATGRMMRDQVVELLGLGEPAEE